MDSFEQMLLRLHSIFERLKWAGLSMKASKCRLFETSATYLGHVISREGLRMDPDKVKAVIDKIKVDGLKPTLQAVQSKLDQPLPMGYCKGSRS